MGTLIFLAFMAFLFKFSEIDKWWLWFAVIIGLLAQAGFELRMFGLIIAIGISKVLKDIFSAGQR